VINLCDPAVVRLLKDVKTNVEIEAVFTMRASISD